MPTRPSPTARACDAPQTEGLDPLVEVVTPTDRHSPTSRRHIMGKYFIAWLLGVPAIALLIFWLI
jgi:hypothetical protein